LSKQVETQDKKEDKKTEPVQKINTPEQELKDVTNELTRVKSELDVARKELEDTNKQLSAKTKQLVSVIDGMEEMSGNLTITGGQLTNLSRVLKQQNMEAYNAYVLEKARAKPQIQADL
jgi:septal ring factor EnvC (AmiA/AmiB activator)